MKSRIQKSKVAFAFWGLPNGWEGPNIVILAHSRGVDFSDMQMSYLPFPHLHKVESDIWEVECDFLKVAFDLFEIECVK